MPSPVNPRNRVIAWSNPVQDIVFSVEVDGKKDYAKKAVLGQTYEQLLNLDEGFGNYQLVKKIPLEEGVERWVFVLEFKEQHKYNYEITQVGALKLPVATQTFIIRRASFTGLEMAFSAPPTVGQTWTRMRAYQKRVPDELDGLFVSVGVEWQDNTYEYPEWTVDDQYEIPVKKVVSIVPSDEAPTGPANQSYIGAGKSLRESMTIDTDALDSYSRNYTDTFSSARLMLPDILESVEIKWNTSVGEGQFDTEWGGSSTGPSVSLSGDESGSASASSSVIPELVVNIRQIYVASIAAQRYFFFLPTVGGVITEAQIEAKLPAGVDKWPSFKPESHTITLQGGKISVRANASASASRSAGASYTNVSLTEGQGYDEDRSVTMNSRPIPPTIHGLITFEGDDEFEVSVSATANAEWTGTGGFPSADASQTIERFFTGKVDPSSLPATSPSSIPTSGLYYIEPRVQEWKYDYAMVSVLVFNANQLA